MTIEDIKAAQRGDRRAFGRLVRQYQRMGLSYAVARVGNSADAEDAVQDAFVDAYVRLNSLREPAAFPGWLRRVVHKHCDRRTRRKPPRLQPDVRGKMLPTADDDGSWLLDAIDELPNQQRIVVALHYLGEERQRDVADFLGLPLTTVKKRLHSARARLRKESPTMKNETRTEIEDRIQLFLAVREGDTVQAEEILDRRPDLVDKEEQWTPEEALSGGFTLPHRLTPLLLASSRGDEKTVFMLLNKGADPNHCCGCDAGESPLFGAALAGRAGVVKTLIEAGADTDRRNRAGYLALEVAQLRGHDTVVSLLSGVPEPVVSRPSSEWAEPAKSPRIISGIKGIDFLAPLERNMLVRVHGPAETGLTVLLAELSRNIGLQGGRSVWTSGSAGRWQGAELAHIVAEYGVDKETTVAVSGALTMVSELALSHELVALFVFLGDGSNGEVESALAQMKRTATLTFVIDPWADVTAGKMPLPDLAPPFDAVLCLSEDLAQREVYPALDTERTRSNAGLSSAETTLRETLTGSMLEALLQQPFATAQHLTGQPGELFSPRETLEIAATLAASTGLVSD